MTVSTPIIPSGASDTIGVDNIKSKSTSTEVAIVDDANAAYGSFDGPNSQWKVDTINEYTASQGITVEGVNLKDSAVNYLGATSGSSNTYTISPTPAVAGLIEGQQFLIKANHANTGNSTIDISSLGAKNILNSALVALEGAELGINGLYHIIYDGTQFVLQNPVLSATSWSSAITYSGSGSMTFTSVTTAFAEYRLQGNLIEFRMYATGTVGGSLDKYILFSLPVSPITTDETFSAFYRSAGGDPKSALSFVNSLSGDHVAVGMPDATNWPFTGANSVISVQGSYRL